VHRADHVAAVIQLHVALAVGPAAADVGLGLQGETRSKIYIKNISAVL
jgi:hypothetical protein